jgi:UDP-glucose 4-epimerase
MKTVLVTGAAGAIGQQLVRHLAGQDARVIGLGHGRVPEGLPIADWINGEVEAANLDTLAARQPRPDAVIHLAGGSTVAPSLAAPADDFARTAVTSVRLLEWVRLNAPEAAIVMTSSAAVYGDAAIHPIPETAPRAPLSPYGTHKMMMELAAESWARNFGVRVAAVRLFSVYGPGMRKQLVWEICTKLSQGARTLTLGGTGSETRDWVHIEDAAAILADAVQLASPAAPIFNGCTGVGTSVRDVAQAVVAGFGTKAEISFSGQVRPGDPVHLVGCPALANRQGLKTAIAAREGLGATAAVARTLLGG